MAVVNGGQDGPVGKGLDESSDSFFITNYSHSDLAEQEEVPDASTGYDRDYFNSTSSPL